MKFFLTIPLFLIAFSFTACGCEKNTTAETITNENAAINEQKNGTMKITIGTKVFTATLQDNETAKDFKATLPISFTMTELNGNEKYAELLKNLPAHASNPGTIKSGDLMLYGSHTLVLFYETFSTNYSYTKIGSIDNVSGLKDALGAGNVMVKFELQ